MSEEDSVDPLDAEEFVDYDRDRGRNVLDVDSGKGAMAEVFVKNFVADLDEEEREQFDLIQKQLAEDFDDVTPLQLGMMAVSYVIQLKALSEGYQAMKNNNEMEKSKRDLLELARKLYSSEVGRVAKDNRVEESQDSIPKLVRSYERRYGVEGEEPDEIDFEPDFDPVSLDEVEARASGGDEEGADPDGTEATVDRIDVSNEDGNDDPFADEEPGSPGEKSDAEKLGYKHRTSSSEFSF